MLLTMPKKKPDGGGKPARKYPIGIQFFTTEAIAATFQAYLDSLPSDRRPSRRAALEKALVQYLTANGFPPPDEAGE